MTIPSGGIAICHQSSRRRPYRIAHPTEGNVDASMQAAPLGTVDSEVVTLEIDPGHRQIELIDISAGCNFTLGGDCGKGGDTQAENQNTNNKPSPIIHNTSAIHAH
jgi:hypothetical protein